MNYIIKQTNNKKNRTINNNIYIKIRIELLCIKTFFLFS